MNAHQRRKSRRAAMRVFAKELQAEGKSKEEQTVILKQFYDACKRKVPVALAEMLNKLGK